MPQRVGHQLGDEELGQIRVLMHLPRGERVARVPPRVADGGSDRRETVGREGQLVVGALNDEDGGVVPGGTWDRVDERIGEPLRPETPTGELAKGQIHPLDRRVPREVTPLDDAVGIEEQGVAGLERDHGLGEVEAADAERDVGRHLVGRLADVPDPQGAADAPRSRSCIPS